MAENNPVFLEILKCTGKKGNMYNLVSNNVYMCVYKYTHTEHTHSQRRWQNLDDSIKEFFVLFLQLSCESEIT